MNTIEWSLDHCITCYMCLAACPVYKRHPNLFLGPAGLVKLGKLHSSHLDNTDHIQMAVRGGVQLCENYGACQEVCPQHIRIVPAIHLLQDEATKRNLRDSNGVSAKTVREMTEGFI